MTDALIKAIEELQESVRDPRAFQKCCEELTAIIASPKDDETNGLNLTAVTTDSVITSMVSAMESFPEDEKVQESAFHFLSTRSLRHPNKHSASQSCFDGEIRAIIAAMKRFPKSLEIQSLGCKSLGNLNVSDRNRTEIVKLDGMRTLLHAIDTFPNVPDCIQYGIGSIARLNTIRSKYAELYQENLEYFKQGVERVPGLMITYREDAQVSSQLMLALFNMRAIFDWNKIEAEHLRAFITIVRNNLNRADIQRFAIFLFLAIGENERCVDMLVDLGGVQAVVAMLHTFFKDPAIIMDNGVYFLSFAAKNSIKGAEVIASRESGAIETVLSCMEKHFNVTVIQNYACEFMKNLTKSVSGRRALADRGGIPILLRVMREYYDCGQVQINGIEALSNMLALDDIREKYYNDKLEKEIIQGLSKYAAIPSVNEAIRIIRREKTEEAEKAAEIGVCSSEMYDEPAYQWMYVKQRKGERDVFVCPSCWKYHKDSFSGGKLFTRNICSCRDNRCKQCFVCLKGVDEEEVVTVGDKVAHKRCYKCKTCGKVPVDGKYRLHMQVLYCTDDATKQIGTPEWINAMFYRTTNLVLDLRNCCIFDDGALVIAEIVQSNRDIEKLDITSNEIGSKGLEAIAAKIASLSKESKLKMIDVTETSSNESGFKQLLCACISKDVSLNGITDTLDLGDKKLDDRDGCELGKALLTNTTIAYIDLNRNLICNEGASSLANAVKMNMNIRSINLVNNFIDESIQRKIIDIVKDKTTKGCPSKVINRAIKRIRGKKPKGLCFSYEKLNDDGLKKLADAINETKCVKSIDFWYNQISDDGVGTIIRMLKKNPQIKYLDISYNNIGDVGANLFLDYIKSGESINLKKFHFKGNICSPKCLRELTFEALLHGIAFDSNDTVLDFENSELGDDGAKKVAQILKQNRTIKDVCIASNGIGNEGIDALAEAIAQNDVVRSIDFRNNNADESSLFNLTLQCVKKNISVCNEKSGKDVDGSVLDFSERSVVKDMVFLCDVLKDNTHVKTLDVHGNDIWAIGAAHLSKLLRLNKVIDTVHFQYNGCGLEGARDIGESLRTNSTLTYLDMHGGKLGAGIYSILKSLKDNTTLTYLDVSKSIVSCTYKEVFDYMKDNITLRTLKIDCIDPDDESCRKIQERLDLNKSLSELEYPDIINFDRKQAKDLLRKLALSCVDETVDITGKDLELMDKERFMSNRVSEDEYKKIDQWITRKREAQEVKEEEAKYTEMAEEELYKNYDAIGGVISNSKTFKGKIMKRDYAKAKNDAIESAITMRRRRVKSPKKEEENPMEEESKADENSSDLKPIKKSEGSSMIIEIDDDDDDEDEGPRNLKVIKKSNEISLSDDDDEEEEGSRNLKIIKKSNGISLSDDEEEEGPRNLKVIKKSNEISLSDSGDDDDEEEEEGSRNLKIIKKSNGISLSDSGDDDDDDDEEEGSRNLKVIKKSDGISLSDDDDDDDDEEEGSRGLKVIKKVNNPSLTIEIDDDDDLIIKKEKSDCSSIQQIDQTLNESGASIGMSASLGDSISNAFVVVNPNEDRDNALEDAVLFDKKFVPPKSCESAILENEDKLSKYVPCIGGIVEHVNDIVDEKMDEMSEFIAEHKLTRDDIFAIIMYSTNAGETEEGESDENSRKKRFYYVLNRALRLEEKDVIDLFRGYIWYLLGALKKMPSFKKMTYRGVKNIERTYSFKEGTKLEWKNFSSSTKDLRSAKRFAGKTGVIFRIITLSGSFIEALSEFSDEKEVLLPPDIRLTVVKDPYVSLVDGYTYIDLVELDKDFSWNINLLR